MFWLGAKAHAGLFWLEVCRDSIPPNAKGFCAAVPLFPAFKANEVPEVVFSNRPDSNGVRAVISMRFVVATALSGFDDLDASEEVATFDPDASDDAVPEPVDAVPDVEVVLVSVVEATVVVVVSVG